MAILQGLLISVKKKKKKTSVLALVVATVDTTEASSARMCFDLLLSLFSDEKTWWWWTLLTDPRILAAIFGFIGTVIGAVIPAYRCCKHTYVSVLIQLKQE